jgi:hypothetical protein
MDLPDKAALESGTVIRHFSLIATQTSQQYPVDVPSDSSQVKLVSRRRSHTELSPIDDTQSDETQAVNYPGNFLWVPHR